MRFIFLGTGGYHPNERRHTAGVMFPEIGLVFDAGTGFFRVPERAQTQELQVFLTHAHLDHVVGLTYLLAPMFSGQLQRVSVYSTEQYLQAVREHLFSGPLFPVMPPYQFVPLATETPLPLGGVLTHHPLTHPGGALGFKATWPDRSVAYITDTVVDHSYLEFIRGVDVLIHECYFPDVDAAAAAKTGHCHTTPVAELARAAQVGRLVLLHIDPDRPGDDPIGLATAQAIFPQTVLAEDLMEIDF